MAIVEKYDVTPRNQAGKLLHNFHSQLTQIHIHGL